MGTIMDDSAELRKQFLEQSQENELDSATDNTNTRPSIGYVEGYSKYISKHGGLITSYNDDGDVVGTGEPYRQTEVEMENSVEAEKPFPVSKQVNKQVNTFRNIFGYNDFGKDSDSLEDPTFLIFDLHMDYGESPLFNQAKGFINEYSDTMEELQEREPLYEQFVSMVSKIFPGDLIPNAGNKRHYINSISGMENLFKKIVDYPNDVLTFTLTEDVTMLSQYLSELYSNLVYSYDSHRFMIPDNLLRFNLTIFFRDVREMKSVKYNKNNEYVSEDINENMSKFAYVLHDCQFNFFNSRSFGSDMTVSGYDAGASSTPNILSFSINYKSYSKIMMPQLIDDSVLIDLRERDGSVDGNYERYNNDYKSQFDILETENLIQTNKTGTLTNRQIKPKVKKTPVKDYFNNIKNSFTDELSDVRNVLINKVKDEVTVLSSQAQKALSDAAFGGLNLPPGVQPLTLTKINVYYDDPATAINRVSFLLDSFLDNAIDDIKGNVNVKYDKGAEKGSRLNIYYDTENTFGEEVGRIATDALYPSNGATARNSNLYDDSNLSEGKAPTGDNVYGESEWVKKEPEGDVQDDGTYNEKFPDGDLHDDGQYNEKEPEGDVHLDGVYNDKYPSGDLHEDGQYNEKEPLGNVQVPGQYNEKYPDGDLHEDGSYNEKKPDGDVHEDGQYNEKEPDGSVQEKGTYNEKYPKGDVQPDGEYNEKFPEGDLQPDGEYNEKYPEGDIQPDGEYNEKEPKGDVYDDVEPEPDSNRPEQSLGNVYGKKEEILPEEPEGDVHPDGEYNEKYPKGNIYKNDDDK